MQFCFGTAYTLVGYMAAVMDIANSTPAVSLCHVMSDPESTYNPSTTDVML
jgi:hypothetical protein